MQSRMMMCHSGRRGSRDDSDANGPRTAARIHPVGGQTVATAQGFRAPEVQAREGDGGGVEDGGNDGGEDGVEHRQRGEAAEALVPGPRPDSAITTPANWLRCAPSAPPQPSPRPHIS
ncbi:hypothetical protein ABZ281_03055 [Streptomyces sp. NPDC006265]|uniref:hypothetical protein n=1 Tax=Streptomyces sp. NPDC006265 TaxID=3156740 RepID=UPI0033B0ABD6